MFRPLRIEFPGAVYHVTSRGDRREPIYRDDADRLCQLDVLAEALMRFDADVLTYCLMGNHYHLVVQTHAGQLSRLMRHLNGVYTQAFNRRHGRVGHLLQGRFKAILVDSNSYLVALACQPADQGGGGGGGGDMRDLTPISPWVQQRALPQVPPEFVDGFLHRQQANRQLFPGLSRTA